MKRIIIAAALAAFIALPAAAGAEHRSGILENVIWPCVGHEVEELDLMEHHAAPAATIMFELDRDYYEEVIDAVEAAFREHPTAAPDRIYEAGLAACIQNQGAWEVEVEPEEPIKCDVGSDVEGCN